MQPPPCHLEGLGVLVTRPAQQADGLCELIERAHGRPLRFSTLEIVPTPDPDSARACLSNPGDLLVFVSANAVDHGYALLPDALPVDLEVAAVGQATARHLREIGLEPTLVPQDSYDSEGLLALPELKEMHGRRVVIVRGNEGRPTLGDRLRERGAEVAYAEVYERRLPQRSAANLVRNWRRLVEVVAVSSNAGLDNLLTLLGESGSELVRATPLVVVSQRMRQHASSLGCQRVHVAASAHDRDVVECLCRLAGQ